jgi:hypothetical protein
MELDDCAIPFLADVITTSNQRVGYKDIDSALIVGVKPWLNSKQRSDNKR